jgi:hypothetical protein
MYVRIVTVIIAMSCVTACGSDGSNAPKHSTRPARLANLAHAAWRDASADGTNMDDGPCLGIITDDWVADVAHDPREAVDDERANQCDEYHAGKAHHFVEVTPTGRVFSIDGKRYAEGGSE